MSRKAVKQTITERKREILQQAFKQSPERAVELHDYMKRLHHKSLDGYCGDKAVTLELTKEWTRQMNQSQEAQKPLSIWLGRESKESAPAGILLN